MFNKLKIVIYFYLLKTIHGTNLTKTSINNFCPKYHFETDSSCLMYYLANKTYKSSESFCFNYSNNLINLENEYKWNEIVSQLKYFNLSALKFRIGLFFNKSSLTWYWSNNEHIPNITWCIANNTSIENFTCANILSIREEWCIDSVSCDDETPFICEWTPGSKRVNDQLGNLIENLFYYLDLFAVIFFIFIFCLFLQFCFNQTNYMRLYSKQMQQLSVNDDNDLVYFKKLI